MRDYFAAKALQGIMSSKVVMDAIFDQVKSGEEKEAFAIMAYMAYELADAMLTARRPAN